MPLHDTSRCRSGSLSCCERMRACCRSQDTTDAWVSGASGQCRTRTFRFIVVSVAPRMTRSRRLCRPQTRPSPFWMADPLRRQKQETQIWQRLVPRSGSARSAVPQCPPPRRERRRCVLRLQSRTKKKPARRVPGRPLDTSADASKKTPAAWASVVVCHSDHQSTRAGRLPWEPVWRRWLAPQQKAAPDAVRAQTWSAPLASSVTTPSMVSTCMGVVTGPIP